MAINTLNFTSAFHRGINASNFICNHSSVSLIGCRFVVGALSTRAAAVALSSGGKTSGVEYYGFCDIGSSIKTLYAQAVGDYQHISRVDIVLIESSNSNQIDLSDVTENIGKPVYDPENEADGYIDCLRAMVTLQFPIVNDSKLLNTRKFNLSLSA